MLRKWNSTTRWSYSTYLLSYETPSQCTQLPIRTWSTIGIEWNINLDHFHLTVAKLPPSHPITKCILASDLAKTFDVLRWFFPSIIKIKILLQRLWELKVCWDDPVPDSFMISGLNGDLSSTFSPQSTSLNTTSSRKLTLSPWNFMAFVMHRSKHMQL